MAGQSIREYLVGLGFKIDDSSYNKFNNALVVSGKRAVALGVTAIVAAAAIKAAVDRVARSYEDLYHVGQRTGSAVSTLKAYEYGAKQIGIGYDAARSSAEAFAASVRLNPGLAALTRGMGIDPKDAAKGVVELTKALKGRFGEGGYFIAAKVAEMYGIQETTFLSTWQNLDKLEKKQADYNRRLQEAGIDTKKLASDSVEYVNAVDSLSASIGIVVDKTVANWVPSVTSIVKVVDDGVQALSRINKETGGWAISIGGLVIALGGLKAFQWLFTAIATLGVAGTAAAITGAIATGLPPAAAAAAAIAAIRQAEENKRDGKPIGSVDREAIAKLPWHERMALWTLENVFGADPNQFKALQDQKPAPAAAGPKSTHMIDFFTARGWSREASTGIVANLHRESNLNPRAVGDNGTAFGLAQHRGDRVEAFRKMFGKHMRDATADEQLRFIDHELSNGTDKGALKAGMLLRQAKSAEEAARIFSNYFERPRDPGGEAAIRARTARGLFDANLAPSPGQITGANVNISQKTEIKVDGATDPKRTASEIADIQGRVNSDLTRNTAGAIR